MKGPAPNDRPCYALSEDEDNFTLVELNIVKETQKTNWTKNSPCTILHFHANWKKAHQQPAECAFYLSCLILSIAEGPQRALLKKKANPKFTNIKLLTEPPAKYLKKALEEINKSSQSGSTNMPKINIKKLEESIDSSLIEVRKILGFPVEHPREICYHITSEVIGSATSDTCQLYLEQQSTSKHIFSDKFEEICTTLDTDHKSDAASVISALKNTKSRSHLAVFSISTENDQTYISIVNEVGNHIKMEDWNYIRLIENPNQAMRLHEFTYKKNSSYIDPFTYNNSREGCVVAKMNTNRSYLDTACLSIPKEVAQDRAAFLLDTTYTLCMYITLKRLNEDKARYKKLFYNSFTSKPLLDPFERAPDPFS